MEHFIVIRRKSDGYFITREANHSPKIIHAELFEFFCDAHDFISDYDLDGEGYYLEHYCATMVGMKQG